MRALGNSMLAAQWLFGNLCEAVAFVPNVMSGIELKSRKSYRLGDCSRITCDDHSLDHVDCRILIKAQGRRQKENSERSAQNGQQIHAPDPAITDGAARPRRSKNCRSQRRNQAL